MLLNVAAAYWPDADEVVIDLASTEDDAETLTVADKVRFDLLLESIDLIGTATYRPLSTFEVTNQYIRTDKHFGVRFKSPQRRDALFLNVVAFFGSDQYEKLVKVGLSSSERTEMVLPENPIWTSDRLEHIPTFGSDDDILPENKVILAPEIQSYNRQFDFSEPKPVETYDGLTYVGGAGDRLMLNSQTNSYEIQRSRAPWAIPAYLFMEGDAENLLDNAFFIDVASGFIPTPVGWTHDGGGAVVTATLDFDHQTSSDAKLWKIRFRQNNQFGGFAASKLITTGFTPVTDGDVYCFSAFLKIRRMTPETVVENVRLSIHWYDGTTLLSSTQEERDLADFQNLSIAFVSGTAPSGADQVKVSIEAYDVDSGDDIEISFLAPQLEPGPTPTTRILTTRDQDEVSIPTYNAANQKIRLQFIPGFSSVSIEAPIALTAGPLMISLKPVEMVEVNLNNVLIHSAPLAFDMGELVDLTVSHKSNGKLQIYRDGIQIAEANLGTVASTTDALTILGIGVELLKLDVFSRT